MTLRSVFGSLRVDPIRAGNDDDVHMLARSAAIASLSLLAAAALACGDSSPSGTSAASTLGSTSAQPGTVTGSSGDPGTTTDSFPPGTAQCGNGYVEGEEQCDDGNADDGDGCNNDCLLRCGLVWSAVVSAPTPQSDVQPRAVVADAQGNVIVTSFQREIITDEKGEQSLLDDVARVVKFDGLGAPQWDVLVAADLVDLDAAGVAVDAAGDIYLAATLRQKTTTIGIYKLSGADGSVMWDVDYDSGIGDDRAFDIAVAPDGNIVVSGQVSVAVGDDDIWVRALEPTAGQEQWTSTWSGVGNGEFSTDNGGKLAVAPDGSIFVFAQEYVSFSSFFATALRFPAAGGDVDWAFQPVIEKGLQDYEPLAIAVDPDGDVLLTFRHVGGVISDYYVFNIAVTDQSEKWRKGHDDFMDIGGDEPTLQVAAVSGPDILVLGQARIVEVDTVRFDAFVSRLDSTGAVVCEISQEAPSDSLDPASLFPQAVAAAADDGAVIAAQQLEDNEASLWVGQFRSVQ